MGKIGRVACIVLPYILTIGALICLIVVGIGSTNSSSEAVNELYFIRVDLSSLTNATTSSTLADLAESAIKNDTRAKELGEALEKADKDAEVRDFYDVGLWGYCTGNKTTNGDFKVDHCSSSKAMFWFNPSEVWGLNDTGVDTLFPESLQKGLSAYEKASKWMFIAYVIAVVSVVAELLVGISAIFSRLGSCITSFVSGIATFFTIAAAITSTALYAALVGLFNTSLKDYQIHASVGGRMIAVTWLAAAFSIASGLFWAFSSCCCSGQSRSGRRGLVAEKVPYTYERVASPYMGMSAVDPTAMYNNNHESTPMFPALPQPVSHAAQDGYEPFRHNRGASGA
ncbi:integral membrane protein [Talaromyces proteolyticus]|uniref:Integral membrane protein n=1 Tax=Talaromyces proteolyticus TaxID=1131652 RepID=A0AAD4KNI8_9EURO|nr:uncharacterized protein BGW36DRAFT_384655 [Talaromyces proteolyticus]KAH8694280.1 integral membrane protein [Talaromyces proteolyticus]